MLETGFLEVLLVEHFLFVLAVGLKQVFIILGSLFKWLLLHNFLLGLVVLLVLQVVRLLLALFLLVAEALDYVAEDHVLVWTLLVTRDVRPARKRAYGSQAL